jgi:carboxypeptidase C (cathepsin A)
MIRAFALFLALFLAAAAPALEAPKPPFAGLPADATTTHRRGDLDYTARAGTIYLKRGDKHAGFFHVDYTLDRSDPARRPVSFVFNGGPGAASAFLHLGAMGPRVIDFGADGAVPPRQSALVDNPDTWLRFTDLVFVDPVGTGFSRTEGGGEEHYWGVKQDLETLESFIRQWSQANGRSQSPKYLVGESYGGFRAAALPASLATDRGIAIAGVVLVSPALEFRFLRGDWLDPLPDALRLPSFAAVHLERAGRLSPETLREAEEFALGDYLLALVRGRVDGVVVARVASLTGLSESVVERTGGRVPIELFMKEYRRGDGQLVSRYDGSVTGTDPYPYSSRPRGGDPLLDASIAPYTSAMLAYLKDELGVTTDLAYRLLNRDVGGRWDWKSGLSGSQGYVGAADELRQALARDGRLRVLVAHGMTDLQTGYMPSRYVIDHLPERLRGQVALKLYPGGHMMYMRSASRAALARDAEVFFRVGD